jgi:hypothetical protein
MKDVVVMLMRVDDRPLLDRTELDPLIDAAGIELLAIDEEAEFCQWPAASASGAVAEKVTVRRLVISDSLMVCSGAGGNSPGSFMSIGAPDTTTLASGPTGEGCP